MKTVKVTTEDRISIVDVDFDDFRSIQKAIRGHFETVRTQRMRDYFGTDIMMIVDEEGHLKQLPLTGWEAGSTEKTNTAVPLPVILSWQYPYMTV